MSERKTVTVYRFRVQGFLPDSATLSTFKASRELIQHKFKGQASDPDEIVARSIAVPTGPGGDCTRPAVTVPRIRMPSATCARKGTAPARSATVDTTTAFARFRTSCRSRMIRAERRCEVASGLCANVPCA